MKKILLALLCVILCLSAVSCGNEEKTEPKNPSLVDALATFHHNGITVYPEKDFASLCETTGANNATKFMVDNEWVVIYEFSSEEDFEVYKGLTDNEFLRNGLLALETDSESAKEIFKAVEEGNAKRWAVRVAELTANETFTIPRTCEVTLKGVSFGLDAFDGNIEASDDEALLEMQFALKNISTQEFDAYQVLWARFYYNDKSYQGSTLVFDTQTSSSVRSFMLQPAESCDVLIIGRLPEDVLDEGAPIESEIIISDMYFYYTITDHID